MIDTYQDSVSSDEQEHIDRLTDIFDSIGMGYSQYDFKSGDFLLYGRIKDKEKTITKNKKCLLHTKVLNLNLNRRLLFNILCKYYPDAKEKLLTVEIYDDTIRSIQYYIPETSKHLKTNN